MTRPETKGAAAQAAALTAETAPVLPERLSWPAAAAVILAVSLMLWVLIGAGIALLIG